MKNEKEIRKELAKRIARGESKNNKLSIKSRIIDICEVGEDIAFAEALKWVLE